MSLRQPDPVDPLSFNHRFVQVASGMRYHLVDQAPMHWRGRVEDAPTILCLHGFPDLWYGWRYQIKELIARGYRVIVPSQLGYAGSSQPATASYSFRSICYDMNSLLDQVGCKGQVTVVGHDWGGMIAWRFANYFSERVFALVSVCTPYQAPTKAGQPMVTPETIIKYLPNFGYQLWLSAPEAAEELDEVIDLFLQPMFSAKFRSLKNVSKEGDEMKMSSWTGYGRLQASVRKQIAMRRAVELPPRVPAEKELDYYIDTFKKYGMSGPLNWYKIREINYAEETAVVFPPFPSHIPCLQLPAELDAALPPSMCLAPNVLKCFPDGNLDVRVLEGADHWCLQDVVTRDNVTGIIADWIDHVHSGKWKPAPLQLRL